MAETAIADEHKEYLASMEHVGVWLASQRARLQQELQLVLMQQQRHGAELTNFLQLTYGLDAQRVPVTLDTARGVLVTPPSADDEEEPASSSSEAEQPAQ